MSERETPESSPVSGATAGVGTDPAAGTQSRMFSNLVAEKAWNLWAYPETFVYAFEGKYRIKCPVCEKVIESESEEVLIDKAISHANEHILCLLAGMEMGMRK
jgi:hypothetical protein